MGVYRCNKCGTVAEHNYMAGMDPVARSEEHTV